MDDTADALLLDGAADALLLDDAADALLLDGAADAPLPVEVGASEARAGPAVLDDALLDPAVPAAVCDAGRLDVDESRGSVETAAGAGAVTSPPEAGCAAVETAAVETAAVDTDAVDTEGVDAEGVEAEGVETDGVETEGVLPADVDTDGVLTEGTVADGAETDGVETEGTVADGVDTDEVLGRDTELAPLGAASMPTAASNTATNNSLPPQDRAATRPLIRFIEKPPGRITTGCSCGSPPRRTQNAS